MKKTLTATFPDATAAEANRFAGTLSESLQEVDPTVVVQRRRERSDTQDLGASLVVVLGTATATAFAKGIGAWLARNSGARVEFRRDGEVIFVGSHLDSKDIPRIAEALVGK
jgi:hypothetical protein